MPDEPHRELYWKDEASGFVTQHLEAPLDFLQQLANFGSNLVPRAWVSSDRRLPDTVLILVLLKHVITMLDSVIVQLRQGAVMPSTLQLRSLFEASVYIKWILDDDTERRATQYFVSHLRKDLDWTRGVIKGTQENDRLEKSLQDTPISSDFEGLKGREKEILDQAAALERTLNSEDFRAVNDEFERLRTTKTGERRKRDCSWYRPWGPQNFFEMCKRLNLQGEYDIFYSGDSEVMHATTQNMMVSYHGENIVFEPIRNLQGFDGMVRRVATWTMRTYRIVLERYRPSEVDESYRRRYMDEWREPFRNIPKVEVGDGTFREI